jgi:hypothetical protein
MLRLGRRWDRDSGIEFKVGRGWQPFSIDVVQRDRPQRALIIIEIWNMTGDFGAAIRNHDRKMRRARIWPLSQRPAASRFVLRRAG